MCCCWYGSIQLAACSMMWHLFWLFTIHTGICTCSSLYQLDAHWRKRTSSLSAQHALKQSLIKKSTYFDRYPQSLKSLEFLCSSAGCLCRVLECLCTLCCHPQWCCVYVVAAVWIPVLEMQLQIPCLSLVFHLLSSFSILLLWWTNDNLKFASDPWWSWLHWRIEGFTFE